MSDETQPQYSMDNENQSNKGFTSSEVEYAPTSKPKIPPMSTLPMTIGEAIAMATTPTSRISSNSKYQAIHPSSMKPRKNKKEVFFYGDREENLESSTETLRRSKERERNTKPPILKRPKNPESEEPSFERRPALLLRFFPDGTAVLISKFQLHLHVKPKQIRFEPEEDSTFDEPLDYDPSILLNDGKSFEVTYKRLEAIPTTREHNLDEIPEESDKYVSDSYEDEIMDHNDHELVTPSTSSMTSPESPNTNGKISPLLNDPEKQNMTSTTVIELRNTMNALKSEEINGNSRQKVVATVGDSPFFIMTSGEMSALQHQYEPIQAEALRATPPPMTEEQTTFSQTNPSPTTQTEVPSTAKMTTTKEPSTEAITETTFVTTEPTTATTKCLSFRNQLSLALSTEDNIDNSLLKKHILPVEDCNTTDNKEIDTFAKLQSPDTTTEAAPTTTTTIPTTQTTTISTTSTPTTTQSTTTPNPSSNNLVPYLTSKPTNSQLKSNPVVVTSLPVLIDLKNSRNSPVTDAPAWREVTVGVVRDQQGQTLKPRYNNWTAHLRTMKRKPGNKFWNELTTPQPMFENHNRLPSQTIQQAPSHVHQAFWTDIQRQRPPVDHQSRNRQTVHSQNYQVNPPRNYHSPNVNEFQWRNSGYNSNNNRWNANIPETFHTSEDVRRMKSPMVNQRNFENQEVCRIDCQKKPLTFTKHMKNKKRRVQVMLRLFSILFILTKGFRPLKINKIGFIFYTHFLKIVPSSYIYSSLDRKILIIYIN